MILHAITNGAFMFLLNLSLVFSAFLCSLVAGFLFAWAVVIMPGIRSLDDKAFIRAFQVTDRVIQNGHPLFMLVWLGSAVAIIVCGLLGLSLLQGVDLVLLFLAVGGYLAGVQGSTIAVHLPLNNTLQRLDLEAMGEEAIAEARAAFESRWNRSNVIRTAIACAVSLLLILLLFRL